MRALSMAGAVLPQAAFFHKPTRTLLVTDAVVYLSEDPPEVLPRHRLPPSTVEMALVMVCPRSAAPHGRPAGACAKARGTP